MEIIYSKIDILRKKPINFEPKDELIFQQVLESSRPECHLLRIKNITVLKDSLLDTTRWFFYDDYTHAHGFKKKYQRFKKIIRYVRNFMWNKTVKIEKAVWICDNWSPNYYHWFMDCIPRLLMSEKYLDDHVIVLPERFKSFSFIEESLDFLGKNIVYASPKINYQIFNLVLPSRIGEIGQYRIELLNKLRIKFLTNSCSEVGFKKVFMMRRHGKARNIINRDLTLEVLKEYKYEIHFFEDYPLLKQIDIIRKTKTLVGIHGAGLTNMVFMPKGGIILEFRNGEDGSKLVNCFFTLASELDLNYYYTTNKSTSPKTNNGDFEINLIKLRKALEDIEKNI